MAAKKKNGKSTRAELIALCRKISIDLGDADLVTTAEQLLKQGPRAPKTNVAYAADYKKFCQWAGAHGKVPRPAAPEVVALYIVDLFRSGKSYATISRALTAIRVAHEGHADPTAAPIVTVLWDRIHRVVGEAPRSQARPIMLADLEQMILAIERDDTPRGIRDRTILLIGWEGMFRRGEMSELRWRHISEEKQGVLILIERSKTDQYGRGKTIGIPHAKNPRLCGVRALRELREVCRDVYAGADLAETPVFLQAGFGGDKIDQLLREPCSDKAIGRVVKRAARAAELPHAGEYSAHSLRRGLATEGHRKGISELALMRHGRWRTRTSLDRYIEQGSVWELNPLVGLV